jgi:transcriptional regulator with GAF, ATPase, and Fis domain
LNGNLAVYLLSIGITALCCSLAAWIIWRAIKHRLMEMIAVIHQFTAGDPQARVIPSHPAIINDLAQVFNQMADQVSTQQRILATQVAYCSTQNQRTTQVTQIIHTSSDLQSLITRWMALIHENFNLHGAACYLLDHTQQSACLYHAIQADAEFPQFQSVHIPIGPLADLSLSEPSSERLDRLIQQTITSNQLMQIPARIEDDSLTEASPTSPDLQFMALPLSFQDQVMGVLILLADRKTFANPDDLDHLQLLSRLISPVIQQYLIKAGLDINLQEIGLLSYASHQIAHAENPQDIFEIATRALQDTPYYGAFFKFEKSGWRVYASPELPGPPEKIPPPSLTLDSTLASPRLIRNDDPLLPLLPAQIQSWLNQLDRDDLVAIPVQRDNQLDLLVILSPRSATVELDKTTFHTVIEPYINLAEWIASSLDQIRAEQTIGFYHQELQALEQVSESVAQQVEIDTFFNTLRDQIYQVLQVEKFFLALYDPQSKQIEFAIQHGDIEPDLLQAGFSSESVVSLVVEKNIPIRLFENVIKEPTYSPIHLQEKKPFTTSWLGIPLPFAGESLGALVIQESGEGLSPGTEAQRFLSIIAADSSILYRYIQLQIQMRQRTEREMLANEIVSRMRHSTRLDTILQITADELQRALGAQRAYLQVKTYPTSIDDVPEAGTQAP